MNRSLQMTQYGSCALAEGHHISANDIETRFTKYANLQIAGTTVSYLINSRRLESHNHLDCLYARYASACYLEVCMYMYLPCSLL